jgi:PST family polysaccharide transporter
MSVEVDPTSQVNAAPDQPSLAVRAIGSSVWSVGGQVGQVLLSLATFGLLSRWLTPFDYGLIGMASTVTAFLGIIGDAGVSWAVTRLQRIDASAEATGFWLSIGGGSVLTIISLIAAPVLARFYHSAAVGPLALALATTFLLAAPGRVSNAKLGRNLRFRALTLISLCANLAGAVLSVVLAMRGFGAWALVAQMVATFVVQGLVTIILMPPRIAPRHVSRTQARGLARVGWQVSGYGMTQVVGRSLDGVLAGRYLGSAAVGYMGMGQRLVFIPMERLSASAAAVFVPTIVELDNLGRQARAFREAVRLLLLLGAPFCAGIFAIAPEVVALLPAKWSALAPILRAYAVGSLFSPFIHLTFSVLLAHGRSGLLLTIAFLLIPVTWGGAVLGAALRSVLVMAMVWGVGAGLCGVVQLVICARILKLRQALWSALLVPVAAAAVMAVAVRLVLRVAGCEGTPAGVALGVAVGAAVYAGLAWLTMRADIRRVTELLMKAAGRGTRRPVAQSLT